MKWLVTVWLSADPDDFMEVRVHPADSADEAIRLVDKLLSSLCFDFAAMSAVAERGAA